MPSISGLLGAAKVPGVVVHDPAGVRRTLYGLGAGAIAAAGVGAYENHEHAGDNPWGIAGSSVGAAAGIALVTVGAAKFHKRFMHYMDGATYSGLDAAVDGAAKYTQDVAVHRQPGGSTFGLLDIAGSDVDNRGVQSVDLGNQHVDIAAVRTLDGDVHRELLDGSYANTGVRAAERIDLDGATALTPELEAQLQGTKLGTSTGHEALTFGARTSPTEGFATRDEAEQWGFEQGTADVATLQVGDRHHVFATHGADAAGIAARGRAVKPGDAVTLVSGEQSLHATNPGDAYDGAAITRYDVDAFTPDEARSLAGRRLALGGSNGSKVIRVGAKTDEFPSRDAAEQSLFDRGSEHLLVDHGGTTIAYDIDEGSAIDAREATLLGPDSSVRLFRGAHGHGVHDGGITRMSFRDLGSVPLADAASLQGQRIAGVDAPYVTLGALQSTHADVDAANAAARETNHEQLVLQLQGGVARYDVAGGVPRAQESASRLGPDAAVRNVLERKQYAPDGPDWNFAGRSVPFVGSEPLGFDILGEGAAVREVGVSRGVAAAQDDIVARATLSTSYGAVHGNGSDVHVYELGSSGSGWDEQLGRAEGAASRHYKTDESFETHDVPYPYQNWQQAYVEKIDLRRDWTRLDTHEGSSTHRDTGWRETGRSQDWSRTSQLQNQRHQQYDQWKRQQDEAERRRNGQ